MRKVALSLPRLDQKIHHIASSLLGCALITLASFIRIPCYPVPFTLQTLAVFFIGLWQTPRQAALSCICYLLLASVGFPVLGGKANPSWILGPTGGYLIAFPLAAFLLAFFRKKTFLAFLIAQAVIWFFGWIWLSFFIDPKAALWQGVILFFPSFFYKALAAFLFDRGRRLWFL